MIVDLLIYFFALIGFVAVAFLVVALLVDYLSEDEAV
jgi:hypothetical protein